MYPQQPGIFHCSSMQSQQQKYSTPSHRRNVGAHACHCDKTNHDRFNDRIIGHFTPLQMEDMFCLSKIVVHTPTQRKRLKVLREYIRFAMI